MARVDLPPHARSMTCEFEADPQCSLAANSGLSEEVGTSLVADLRPMHLRSTLKWDERYYSRNYLLHSVYFAFQKCYVGDRVSNFSIFFGG